MEKKIRVIFADADVRFSATLCNALEKHGAFELCAAVSDGLSALEEVRTCRPDLLVLDLSLPHLDGLGLLDALRAEGLRPRVLVLSAQSNHYVIRRAMEKGVCYCIPKPCQLSSFLERMLEAVELERPAEPAAEVEWTVLSALRRLGLRPSDEGTELARKMLLLAVEVPTLLRRPIAKNLYTRVLRGEQDSVASVERALRSAIETAWTEGDCAFQEQLFGATVRFQTGRPTNADFLVAVADYVRLSLRYRAQHGEGGLLQITG